MSAKLDKNKLIDAVNSVGAARSSGVLTGARVNAPKEQETGVEKSVDVLPVDAPKEAAPSAVDAVAKGGEEESRRTARLGFHCTPAEKKILKQLALDMDTSVSELVHEALLGKGYLKA